MTVHYRDHIPGLDGLRAVAVGMVVVSHAMTAAYLGRSTWLLNEIGLAGWTGVDLFFVLSGLLITGILIDTDSPEARLIQLRAFYARRVLRIWPLYLTIAAIVALASALAGAPFTAGALAASLAHLTNLYDALVAPLPRPILHFWSLAVEEQFYLVWPLVLLVTPRPLRAPGIVVLWIGGALLRYGLSEWGVTNHQLMFLTVTRADGLLSGALLALLIRSNLSAEGQRRWALTALCAGLGGWILLAVSSGHIAWTPPWRPLEISAGLVAIVLFWQGLVLLTVTPGAPWLRWVLGNPILESIGRHSYAIYLIHVPLDQLVRAAGLHPKDLATGRPLLLLAPAYALVVLVVSWALAKVTWRLIEAPALRFKDHFEYPK